MTAPAPARDPAPEATTAPPLPASFKHLARANLAAQAAEQISMAAVPIVAVLALQAGPREIGWLAAAQSLPFLLLAMPMGTLADSGSRRQLMLLAEALRLLAMLGLVGITASGHVSLEALALLGFLGAAGTVAFTVAAPALVPKLVPGAALGLANSRLELARSVAFAAGPALGGALVGTAGASSAFVLAAVLVGAALASLLAVPRDAGPAKGSRPPRRPWQDVKDGLRFVMSHALLRPVFVCAIAWNISWFTMQAAFVPHAMSRLQLSASGVGLVMAFYGIGMVFGALLSPALMRRLAFGTVVVLGPVCSVVAALLMAASTLWPQPALAAAAFFVFGAGPIVWTVSTTTLRQTITRPEQLGRVGALFLTANAGARPLGAALGAIVGWMLPPGPAASACLWIAALGFCVQALVIFCSAMPRLQTLPPQAA